MLTNMESQLKEQGALARLDEVLEEIPRVRADLGYLPLVTPTSPDSRHPGGIKCIGQGALSGLSPRRRQP